MHLLGRDSVHLALGLAHQPERAYGALLHPIGNRRPLDQPHQLAHVASVRLLGDGELDLFARYAAADGVSNGDSHSSEPQPPG